MIEFSPQETEYLVPGIAGLIQCKARAGLADKFRPDLPVAVICHPHPLFGGTMDNKVVTTLARVFRDQGMDQLRFNFRGVGKSEGLHDNMLGESEDLGNLLNLIAQSGPPRKYLLAGFSFGSGVVSKIAQIRADVAHSVLVAPPVEKYSEAYADNYPAPISIFQGALDDVVDPARVKDWVQGIKSVAHLHWFADAGHFFHGRLNELYAEVEKELLGIKGIQNAD